MPLQRRSHDRLAAKDAMDQIRSAIRVLMEREPSVIGASGGFATAKLRVRPYSAVSHPQL